MSGSLADVTRSLWGGEYEQVSLLSDPASGMRGILAIHDTSRGPALGGIRCRAYPDEATALDEVLGLAKAMTRKVCLADLPAGGGKVVLDDHPGMDRPAAYRALGRILDSMGGRFFTSADLGTSEADLEQVAQRTRYVTRARDHLGDLCEKTAEGVFECIGTCMDVMGMAEWRGRRIAIQGLGRIGLHLAVLGVRAGAEVLAADTDSERMGNAVDTLPITPVDPREIFDVKCDVFAPCALGRVLDHDTIPRLRCRAVVGAANDVLANDAAGDLLQERGILFAPDVITSAGAVVAGAGPGLAGYDAPKTMKALAQVLRSILMASMTDGEPPHRVAYRKADRIWQEARTRRAAATP